MQYVVTISEKFPITFSIPVCDEIKDRQRILRRDESGGEIIVYEEITREKHRAKSVLLPASLRGQDPGRLVLSETDYEALIETDYFNSATTPKMQGGLGWATVSIDTATVRRLAAEKKALLKEGKASRMAQAEAKRAKAKPAPVHVVEDPEAEGDEEEAVAPKASKTSAKRPPAAKAADESND